VDPQEQCRLVAILGMGGIGKSALASMLGYQFAGHFEAVLWRSVRDAPSCEELVADCISFCSETPPAEFPTSFERRIDQLVARLQARRCVLVLDNLESLLEEGSLEGNYRAGYAGYGRLIQRLAESAHQSCVLITSRESPKRSSRWREAALRCAHCALRVWMRMSREHYFLIRIWWGGGFLAAAHRHLRWQSPGPQNRGPHDCRSLRRRYCQFLQSGELVFNGIRAVLRQQVGRLTPVEQVLLTWLAVAREWISLDALLRLAIPRVVRARALEALEALRRRSLLERGSRRSLPYNRSSWSMSPIRSCSGLLLR